jgi:hypothetical protein
MTIAARWRKTSVLIILSALAVAFPRVAQSKEIAGKIVSLSGTVLVRNAKDEKPVMTKAKVGDEIAEGSVINTDSSGSAKLLLTDKSIIDLGPSTLFKVDEYNLKNGPDRKVGLTMDYGKIRASVNAKVSPLGKYGVRAKSVTMGVRGTEFVVLSDLGSFVDGGGTVQGAKEAPQTAITVVHGKVEVADTKAPASKPVEATAGTQVKVADAPAEGRGPAGEKAEAPQVVKLSQEEVQQVKSEAKQADETFVQAVVVDTSSGGGGETLATLSGEFFSDMDGGPEFDMPPMFDSTAFMPVPNMQLNAMPVTVRVVFVK